MDKVAFVFAGQGAQYPGMGRDLYASNAHARALFDRAERLRPGTLNMCFGGDENELKQTVNAQPCLFAVDYVCAALCADYGVKPACLAGFSLGEVAAAAFSGMLAFDDAFLLVTERARLMDECAKKNPGEMYAVLRLGADEVSDICQRAGRAWPVNFNCPGQIVVACARDAAGTLIENVKAAGGRAMKLPVSGAFHSPFMADAAAGLLKYMANISFQPGLPVYANRTSAVYAPGAQKETLAAQVCSPVLWEISVRNMIADGVTAFVEVGPGKTLTNLIGKIDPSVKTRSASDVSSVAEVGEALS